MKSYLDIECEKANYHEKFELGDQFFHIGYKSKNNDVGFDESVCGTTRTLRDRLHGRVGKPALSRMHCTIKKSMNQIYVTDDGSRTGTYLNGKRISKRRKKGFEFLESGDIVGLVKKGGDFLIKIKYTKED